MSTYTHASGTGGNEPPGAERFEGNDSCSEQGHFYDDGYCEFCGVHEDDA